MTAFVLLFPSIWTRGLLALAICLGIAWLCGLLLAVVDLWGQDGRR